MTLMNNLAVALAATPGPPVGTFALDVAPALAPLAGALVVLAGLAGVVLLVVRDARRRVPPLRPSIAIENRDHPARWSA